MNKPPMTAREALEAVERARQEIEKYPDEGGAEIACEVLEDALPALRDAVEQGEAYRVQSVLLEEGTLIKAQAELLNIAVMEEANTLRSALQQLYSACHGKRIFGDVYSTEDGNGNVVRQALDVMAIAKEALDGGPDAEAASQGGGA